MSDYEIGYGKPPKHSQFKPGQSGNPKGKKSGSLGLKAELRAELDQRVSITENGKTRKVSKRRLIIKSLIAKAAKGDVRAADRLLHYIIQGEGFEDQRPNRAQLSDADRQIIEQFLGKSGGVSDAGLRNAGP